jgi:hypothetical protein
MVASRSVFWPVGGEKGSGFRSQGSGIRVQESGVTAGADGGREALARQCLAFAGRAFSGQIGDDLDRLDADADDLADEADDNRDRRWGGNRLDA